ncbi:MAG: MFS transporter [Aestuariivirga sp.]
MLQAILFAVKDARIRVISVALVMLGFTYASTIPFQSIVGVEQLHMSESQFAWLIFGIGFAGMVGNLVLGALSDFAKNRKTFVLFCLLFGAIGFGLFAVLPSTTTFLICLLLVTPISGSAYSLLFGTVRAITAEHSSADAASINSAVRSFYAVSWIVVPGIVGLLIAYTNKASDSFAVAALAFTLCLIFYWLFGPQVVGGIVGSTSALSNLREALGSIFKNGRGPRLLALSLISSPHPLIAAIFPLVLTQQLGGSTSQLGWFLGLVALLEIPLTLLIGATVRRFNLWAIIIFGGLSHIGFLISLGLTTSLWSIYLLAILYSMGNAVLLSQQMSYAQDLLPDRPGLGSSLISVVILFSRGLSALIFAGLSLFYGFTGALIAGAAICLLGCLCLAILDHGAGMQRSTA